MTDKLSEICATKRREVADRKALATLDDLDRAALATGAPRGFRLSLEAKARVLQARLADTGQRIAALQKEQQQVRERLQALDKLEEYRDYAELDWRSSATELAALQDEKQRLETASDVLKALAAQLSALETALAATAGKLKEREAEQARALLKQEQAVALRATVQQHLEAADFAVHQSQFERIESWRAEALGESAVTRHAEVYGPNALYLGDRIGGPAKACQGDPGAACPQHVHPPANRRVGYVMYQVQDMQHETRPLLGPPIGDASTAFAASQHFWCSVAIT